VSTVKLHAGVELHNMSPDEFRGILAERSAADRAALRGIKHAAYFPKSYQGKASGGVLQLGEAQQLSPAEGYIWAIRRIVLTGLTAGATPDVVNLYFDDSFSQAQWQFDGNHFGYGWGRGEMTIGSGQALFFQSVGTFNATGTIFLGGQYDIVPAEMAGKLVL